MNDQELADKVVALGVGHTKEDYGKVCYVPPDGDDYHDILSAFGFVRNWRVAGALMEKLSVHLATSDCYEVRAEQFCIELPIQARNVIEDCCEALQ